jgi:CHAT domain-containing protein
MRAARATALVVVNRVGEGINELERALESDGRSAPRWSDLGAAYLERFNHDGSATDLLRGLESIERSLTVARLPEALFNRALLLDRLNLTEAADAAWNEYLTADAQSPWAREARSRLTSLRDRTRSRERAARAQYTREALTDDLLWRWARERDKGSAVLQEAQEIVLRDLAASADHLAIDLFAAIGVAARRPSSLSLLQGAHAAYAEGREFYRKDAFAHADRLLAAAEDKARQTESPLVLLARMYRGIICYRRNDPAGAAAVLTALLADVPLDRYPSIRGRTLWTLGLLATLRGDHAGAIRAYDDASDALARADEQPNLGFVRMLRAAQLEFAGDLESAWNLRLRGLPLVDRESPFQSAAISALDGGWPRVASVFYDTVATMARRQQRDAVLAEAIRGRARTLASAGALNDAQRALGEARRLATRHPEANWDAIRAEIDLADAESLVLQSPDRAIEAASRSLSYFRANKRDVRIPESLLARARAQLARRDDAAAEADLNEGLEAVGSLRARLSEWRLRALLGNVVQKFGDELVALKLRTGQADEAFDAGERLRDWDLRMHAYAGRPPASSRAITKAMPPDAALLWFLVQDERSYVWLLARGAATLFTIPAGRREIERLVAAQPVSDRAAASRLRDLLLGQCLPLIDQKERLIIVPDGAVHLVPFAALPGRRKPFLIEEHVLHLSPSASVYLASLAARATPPRSALVVGNPEFDRDGQSGLRDLRESSMEAAAVADLYPQAVLLTGPTATRAAIVAALPDHEVFHFAGHSLANNVMTGESRLVVAGPASGAITANDISEMPLANVRYVILSSCDSVAGTPTRSEGPLGLARAFLSAGAKTVLASLTPVEDRSARELAMVFHRELRRSGDAAAALRLAQLTLMRSSDPALSAPGHWATFVVVGAQ